ncbi:stage II sporulation protein E [Sporolactobacillus pectinivorans]|uniref:stage II sporulation protein E n=1 Tax=Sporolactobacillus pectinivorans TaxID=1591408 RepID=UPI001EFEDBAE|nr:stage II sporulation protein E [Sporolactobacillus pectinivorans]
MIQRSFSFGERVSGSMEAGRQPVQGNHRIIRALRTAVLKFFCRTEFFFLIAGFLLGRAVILSTLTPFILPFFATIFWLNRRKKWRVSAAPIAGALTVSVGQAFYAVLALLAFLVAWKMMQTLMKNKEGRWLPVLVLLIGFFVRLLYQAVFTLDLVWSDALTAAAESSLAFLVMLIFMQSVPLLSARVSRKLYKNEEMICFVILLSSILAGTIGWTTLGISVDHVLARYAVLLFASAGGAAIGSTVGVVIGLVVGMASVTSLYQMSLLAFSGVLGGLMKEAGKMGTAAGLIIATLLIGLYGGGYSNLSGEVIDSLTAVLLFLATPKELIQRLSFYIPGTREYQKEQQQYIRKLRDATVSRVEQFSSLFQMLAKSFSPPAEEVPGEEEVFLSKVTAKSCRNCFKKEYCWVKNAAQTRQLMLQLRDESRAGRKGENARLHREWRDHCARSEKTMDLISREQGLEEVRKRMMRQVKESRRLVADQLHGVSQVMRDFAGEMKRERGLHDWQEEIILAKLNGAGLLVESVEIYSLESGAVDIEMLLPQDDYQACEKVIAPMLSGILGEGIVVEKRSSSEFSGGPCRAAFASAKAYDIETGAATAARGGGFVSGDNFALFDIGSGKYALAISDGMGNGERADAESKETLQLLAKVLKSGIHETLAIKSINSILSLRSTEEIFATLDLALIDLQNAKSKFLKIGSNPSFVKRGSHVFMLDAGNLPIGMIEEFDVDVRTEQLKSGDLLIMMSDGIFDAQKQIENKEAWVKRKIRELQTDNPQAIADLLLEEVIRMADGQINDDMTVIAARISHHIPKWSSISPGAEKETTVLRKERVGQT